MEKFYKKGFATIIGIFSILVASILLLTDIFQQQNIKQIEYEKIEQFFIQEGRRNEVDLVEIKNEDIEPETDSNYIAVLEIPKLQLIRGLFDIEEDRNNIEENIQILKESDFPNVENGTMILAGHSGIGKSAYFKHLDNLQIGDLIFLYYQGVKYVYQLSSRYEIEKTGYFQVHKNDQKNTLILITCKLKTNLQLVFISELLYQEPIV